MTRQMWYVFFAKPAPAHAETAQDNTPHESPPVMTVPLGVLAGCVILLTVLSTPVWPWFHGYLSGHTPHLTASIEVSTLLVMLVSAVIALGGIGVGWWLYSRRAPQTAAEPDPLETMQPTLFGWLRGKFHIDELYEISVIQWNASCARFCRWLDEKVWENVVHAVSLLTLGVSWLSRLIDEFVVNLGFDQSCRGVTFGARMLSLWQNGQVQRYLRVIALALVGFVLVLILK
jgi:NADH-quinone oxidoreductase subunit L